MHATILKGNMGYDQHTVSDTVVLLLFSFSTRKHKSMASCVILLDFFKEQ